MDPSNCICGVTKSDKVTTTFKLAARSGNTQGANRLADGATTRPNDHTSASTRRAPSTSWRRGMNVERRVPAPAPSRLVEPDRRQWKLEYDALAQKPQKPYDDESVEDPQNQPRPRATHKRPPKEAEREERHLRARQDHPEEYDVPIQETYPVSRDDLHGSVIKKSCSTS